MKDQIAVSIETIEEYKNKVRLKNIVHKFWKSIYISAPKNLQLELKTKRTDLISVNLDNIHYRFYTDNGSKELNDYLSNYLIRAHSQNT